MAVPYFCNVNNYIVMEPIIFIIFIIFMPPFVIVGTLILYTCGIQQPPMDIGMQYPPPPQDDLGQQRGAHICPYPPPHGTQMTVAVLFPVSVFVLQFTLVLLLQLVDILAEWS